jgi:sortase A
MEVGDVLCISTNYGLFEYTIDDLRVLNMSDPTAFNLNKNEEELILYTCYPFDLIGAKTDRLFIYAKKTNGPSVSY